jgi:drug/metabolite transporter (DMT)-like permease
VLAALLCPVLFSISIVCGHRSAKLLGGTEANFWRLTLATFFLGIWAYSFGVGLAGSAFPLFCFSGVVGIGLGDVALFQALPRLGSRVSMLLVQCFTAPFGALLEWLWLGTSLSAFQIISGLTILAGVGIALSEGQHLRAERRVLVVGTLFAILSAVGGAGGAVLSRQAYFILHENHEQLDPANAGFQRVLGGALIAGICLLLVRWRSVVELFFPRGALHESAPSSFSSPSSTSKAHADVELPGAAARKWRLIWPWVLGNSLAGQTLGVSAMQRALETTPTGIVLSIIAATPLVVIPFAMFFEGERPTRRSLAGAAIGVAGVIGMVWSR